MIVSALEKLYENKHFGSDWPMYPKRLLPAVVIDDDQILIYEKWRKWQLSSLMIFHAFSIKIIFPNINCSFLESVLYILLIAIWKIIFVIKITSLCNQNRLAS